MFVTQPDFIPFIKDSRLMQMLDAEPQALDLAVEMAQGVVYDSLYSRYDTATIFAKVGAARDMQCVRWIVVIALYYLYERLPDKLVPERVVKNYNEVLDLLTQIEDGKKSTSLPLIVDAATTLPATKFRWGSNATRTH
jgi:Protein of unknown function (DUF1320)